MLFNPAESIDFNGHTGPFIQYTYARIRSVIRKATAYNELKEFAGFDCRAHAEAMNDREREVVKCVLRYSDELEEAASRFSPAVMANYVYELAKIFNQFYHECPIVDLHQLDVSRFRLRLCWDVSAVIQKSLSLLGIHVPEKM
jgi:arginyl-tRNA synthetase